MITNKQQGILHHAMHGAAGGFYCGDSPEMQEMVALGLMQSAGRKSFVSDEYFRITSEGIKGRKYAPIQAGKSGQASRSIAPSKETIEGKAARDLRGFMRALWIFRHTSLDAGSCFEKRRGRTRKTWRTRRVSTGITDRTSSRIQDALHELLIHSPCIIPRVAALAWRTLIASPALP